jgi:hypothetical protein
MPLVTRIGTFINAFASGLANIMSTRTGIRSILALAVFFVIFVVAYAELDHEDGIDNGRLPWEFWKLTDAELREQANSQHSFSVSFTLSLPFTQGLSLLLNQQTHAAGHKSRLQIPATTIPRRSQKGFQVGLSCAVNRDNTEITNPPDQPVPRLQIHLPQT